MTAADRRLGGTPVPERFRGRVVVITGAASGIGAAAARRFTAEGARVVLGDLDGAGLDRVVAELGGPAVAAAVPTDVSVQADVEALVSAAVATFGRLDVLVNNAGISQFGHVTEIDAEQWHRVMAVDVDSVFYGCRAALPHLAEVGGSIVNTCSISGLFADPGLVAYNTAKGAVANLTRNLAVDHAAEGVRVNSVCPGGTVTPMVDRVIARWADEYARLVPLGRPGQPAEIAAAMAFLASDDASYITGHNLVVDGGVTATTGQPNFDRLLRRPRPIG
jgi:meso-butanediol dehydrogenase/(S,S)-butanediol dehydrogenase/diacetyl reductase